METLVVVKAIVPLTKILVIEVIALKWSGIWHPKRDWSDWCIKISHSSLSMATEAKHMDGLSSFLSRNWKSYSFQSRFVLDGPKRTVCIYFKREVAHSGWAVTYSQTLNRRLPTLNHWIEIIVFAFDIWYIETVPLLHDKNWTSSLGSGLLFNKLVQ